MGGLTLANALFDGSEPESHAARVVDKHISRGKRTSYHLHVAPWVDRPGSEKVTVTTEQYERARAKDAVTLEVMQGALGLRWYRVRTNLP